jgi:hypothetical protein
VAPQASPFDEAELDAIIHRLHQEVKATRSEDLDSAAGNSPDELRTRRELDRIWAVTAERPYLYRPGWWGRMRGTLLVPPKAVIRRLVRWYVEPLAIDQRAYNAGVLRLADELGDRMRRLERVLASLDERVAQLEGTAERSRSPGK